MNHLPSALFLITLQMAAVAHAQPNESSARNCTVLKLNKVLFAEENHTPTAGYYCLDRDITVPLVRDWHAGGAEKYYNPRSYSYLDIWASGTSIDFNGHTLTLKAYGITGIACGSANPSDNSPCIGLSIRNGKIRTRFGSGVDARNYVLRDYRYPQAGIRIESMHIQVENKASEAIGISIMGAGSVIRNNIIEIDSTGESLARAVSLFGSGALIENNLIVYKGPVGKSVYAVSEEEKREYALDSAPIVLADGDSTIIRNNDIVIQRGLFGTPPKHAIALFRSKDVVLENNRVYGASTLYKAFDEKSSIVDKGGNEFRSIFRRPWSRPKTPVSGSND